MIVCAPRSDGTLTAYWASGQSAGSTIARRAIHPTSHEAESYPRDPQTECGDGRRCKRGGLARGRDHTDTGQQHSPTQHRATSQDDRQHLDGLAATRLPNGRRAGTDDCFMLARARRAGEHVNVIVNPDDATACPTGEDLCYTHLGVGGATAVRALAGKAKCTPRVEDCDAAGLAHIASAD